MFIAESNLQTDGSSSRNDAKRKTWSWNMQLKSKNACRLYRVYTVDWNKQGFTARTIDSMEKTSLLYITEQCMGWARLTMAKILLRFNAATLSELSQV